MTDSIPLQTKAEALYEVVLFRPALTAGVVVLSFIAALLEGIGISFLIPIIETARSPGQDPDGGLVGLFVSVYDALGVPFTLGYIVLGVAAVITLRFTASFVVGWLKAALRNDFVRHLRTTAFQRSLDAEIGYYDRRGSDEVLNAIITQTYHAGLVIERLVRITEQALLSLVYLGIALLLAPLLTIGTIVILGGFLFVLRRRIESGYSIGDRVARANERVQTAAQAGTQGIRDVKLFGLADELYQDFEGAVDQFRDSSVTLRRNEAAMDNLYQLITGLAVFVLIYFLLVYSSLSLGGLGVFLFAMYRLGPRVSMLNNLLYNLEGDLPHLVRTDHFLYELGSNREPFADHEPVPEVVRQISFEGVSFAYGDERVLDGVSFDVKRGEFIAFVGASGAGKSTIASLLSRMYSPDEGRITANGVPIEEFQIDEWRSRVAVVRQQPYIFNDTLRYNVTIGNRDASDAEIERACEIAQVTEFIDDLPNVYDSLLGDDGARLSGGQRQRIAIARALLKDADLLILDEATSDLDTHLEDRVHEGIESMDRDYAMLVIAHRLSTVTNADRIYTMEHGRITEWGSHEDLLERDGRYAELYTLQS